MAWFWLARVVFVVVVAGVAAFLRPVHDTLLLNTLFGGAVALVVVFFEMRLGAMPVSGVLGALVGGAAGLVVARTIESALFWADSGDRRVAFLHAAILLALSYLGLVIGARHGEWLQPGRLLGLFRSSGPERRYRILDTSVIIDGRIADVCETGFLDGTLVVPQFVLKELQLVADSSDSLKRNRGRRGLDILQKIQKMAGVEVIVSDVDFPEIREVDLKLIELARSLRGKIVTNDFNLNKVAQLRGIEVLNINELANALKPVVLPGEFMKVFILKEGKEYNQGVAYLDDGTMVVVDNARRLIGKTIDVVVTSVLQTTAGKMIFGRHIETAAAAQAQGQPPPQAPPGSAGAAGPAGPAGSAQGQTGQAGGGAAAAPPQTSSPAAASGPAPGGSAGGTGRDEGLRRPRPVPQA
jgi:uncharacterized protein YacL